MKRCSYTWKKLDRERNEIIEIQCPEEIWPGSEESCIFHDPSPEKDTELFENELEEKLAKKDYNFRGYCFPEMLDFKNKEFEEDANFRGATFQYANFRGATFQYANFRGATFQYANFRGATFQYANFRGATFQKYANFMGATFQKYASFSVATFQVANFWGTTFQDASFRGATFQEIAYFRNATFEKNMEFAPKHIEDLDLRNTQFLFRGTITADLKKTRFHRTYLENVAFIDCEWPERIYEEEHMGDEYYNLTFKELETIYRDLKQNMQRHGDYSQAGKFYYREMEMRRKGSDSRKERIWLGLYNLLAGYGEKPERTALSSAITIFLFAFFYWGLDCLEYPRGNPEFLYGFYHAIYFSFVTFTTLGLGDIHPSNNLGMALICCEAVIGAFLIALFVVVFARKMMR